MRQPATPEDVAVLARMAGLALAPEYLDELVQGYQALEPVLHRLRRGRERADEPAHAFDPRKFMPPLADSSRELQATAHGQGAE